MGHSVRDADILKTLQPPCAQSLPLGLSNTGNSLELYFASEEQYPVLLSPLLESRFMVAAFGGFRVRNSSAVLPYTPGGSGSSWVRVNLRVLSS